MSRPSIIKAGTRRKDLADIYQVDRCIITDWLKEIGVDHSRTLSPKELALFVQTYGIPTMDCEIRIPLNINSK